MAMGAYARWRALTGNEQQLTVKSGMVIGAAVVVLRVFGIERTLRLATLAQGRRPEVDAKNVIGDVVTAVNRAGRYVPGGTCLPKSLALAWMLRGRGVPATVRIGVKTAGQFEAHAWVECNGVAVETVPPGPGYAPILNR